MPFSVIPLLLLIIPIVEIGAFIVIGGQIGIWMTLLMILLTAIIGTILLRIQGLSLINKIQSEISNNRLPGKKLGEGAMLIVAGILLLTPGFVTDGFGFMLFLPFIRNLVWKFMATKVVFAMPGAGGMMGGSFPDRSSPASSPPPGDGPIIDLDEDDYQSGTPDPNSPWNKSN